MISALKIINAGYFFNARRFKLKLHALKKHKLTLVKAVFRFNKLVLIISLFRNKSLLKDRSKERNSKSE